MSTTGRQQQPFEYDLTKEDNEIAKLRAIVSAQEAALAHWRRKSDEDAGRIERYADALRRIAFDPAASGPLGDANPMAARLRAIAVEVLGYSTVR